MFDESDFQRLLLYINKVYKSNFVSISMNTKNAYNILLKKGRKKREILNAINNCKVDDWHASRLYKFITPEYFSREKTLDMYGKTIKNQGTAQKFIDLKNGKFRNI